MNLASDVRGEGVAYLIGARSPPMRSMWVPVTVGLPVAGTRMCADQEMKSMKNTSNLRVGEFI